MEDSPLLGKEAKLCIFTEPKPEYLSKFILSLIQSTAGDVQMWASAASEPSVWPDSWEPWGFLSGPWGHALRFVFQVCFPTFLVDVWVSSLMSSGKAPAALSCPSEKELRCLKIGTWYTSTYNSGVRPFSWSFLWSYFLFLNFIRFPKILFAWALHSLLQRVSYARLPSSCCRHTIP